MRLNHPPALLKSISFSGQPAISTGVVNIAALMGSTDYLLVRSVPQKALSNEAVSSEEVSLNVDSIGNSTEQSAESSEQQQLRLCSHAGLPLGCFFVEDGGSYEVVRRSDVCLASMLEVIDAVGGEHRDGLVAVHQAGENFMFNSGGLGKHMADDGRDASNKEGEPYGFGVRRDTTFSAETVLKKKRKRCRRGKGVVECSLRATHRGASDAADNGAISAEEVREEEKEEMVCKTNAVASPSTGDELFTPPVSSCRASREVVMRPRRFPLNNCSSSSSPERNCVREGVEKNKTTPPLEVNTKRWESGSDGNMKAVRNEVGRSESASFVREWKSPLSLGHVSMPLSNGFLDWVRGRDYTAEDESMPDIYNNGDVPSAGMLDSWVQQESPALGFTYVENTLSQDFSLGSSSVTSSVDYG